MELQLIPVCTHSLGESSIQFSSVAQSCLTLGDPMNRSTPGLPVHHQLLEFTQTHVCWVGNVIQPSHPLLSPYPPALNLSQHQGLFKWVSSSHQVAKVLEFQLQHQFFQWIQYRLILWCREKTQDHLWSTTYKGWDCLVRFSWETELIEPTCLPIYSVKHIYTHIHTHTHNWLYMNRIYVLYMCVCIKHTSYLYTTNLYIYMYIPTYPVIYTHSHKYVCICVYNSSIHIFMYISLSSSLSTYLPIFLLLVLFLWRPLRIHVHTHTNTHTYIYTSTSMKLRPSGFKWWEQHKRDSQKFTNIILRWLWCSVGFGATLGHLPSLRPD